MTESYDRRFERVSIPLSIKIKGNRYKVANISPDGLMLDELPRDLNGDSLFALHELISAELEFQRNGMAITLSCVLKVLRINPENKTVGCQFIDLSQSASDFIHQAIDDYLAGHVNNFTKYFLSEDESLRRRVAVNERNNVLRYSGQVIFFLIVIGIGLGVIFRYTSVVASSHGVIGSDVHNVASPLAGVVSLNNISPGQEVAYNQLLFRVRSNDNEQYIAQLKARLEMARTELTIAGQRLDELISMEGILASSRREQLSQVGQQVELLDESVALATSHVQRLMNLNQQGSVTQLQLEQARLDLAEWRFNLSDAIQRQQQLEELGQLLAIGVYHPDFRDNVPTVAIARLRMTMLQQSIRGYEEELASLYEVYEVRSPCACEVRDIVFRDHEYAQRGQGVLRLINTEQAPFIEALIPASRAARLEIGGSVRVRTIRDQSIRGRLTDVTYHVEERSRIGLPESLNNADRLARVEVLVDEEDARELSPQRGEPVQVYIDAGWWTRIKRGFSSMTSIFSRT